MSLGSLCVLIVMNISAPLALFERWGIGHFGVGWGQPLPQNTVWGKEIHLKLPWVSPVLVTRYHFTMFLILVPLTVITLMWLLKGFLAYPLTTWWSCVFFVVACELGVMMLEDFLFFVFNTWYGAPYPHALARLFNGEATWHANVNLGFCKMPGFYLVFPFLIAGCVRFARWLG